MNASIEVVGLEYKEKNEVGKLIINGQTVGELTFLHQHTPEGFAPERYTITFQSDYNFLSYLLDHSYMPLEEKQDIIDFWVMKLKPFEKLLFPK